MKLIEQVILLISSMVFSCYFLGKIWVLVLCLIILLVVVTRLLTWLEIDNYEKSLYKIFLFLYCILLIGTEYLLFNKKPLDNLAFGIFLSVFMGNFFNLLINKIMWQYMPSGITTEKDKISFTTILGTFEILLYFIALARHQPQFIIFWIGTKVAITWHQLAKSQEKEGGMSSHHIFLIGIALNILWAVFGVAIAFGWSTLLPSK